MDVNSESQAQLELDILEALTTIGKVCEHPLLLPEMPALAAQIRQKFIEYTDNARLLQSTPKENVTI